MVTSLCDIGVDTNYWYPLLRAGSLRRNRPVPLTLWHQRLVVFRDDEDEVHVLDDRCAHRKVALHQGEVRNGRIVCPYHGWEYHSDGRLAAIPYWPVEKRLPQACVRAYPARCRSGLIWTFPGRAELAELIPLPDTSSVETDEWFYFQLDNEFQNHYSIGIVNGMDYYHFHLHRKYQPWSDIRLLRIETDEESVVGEYEILSTRGFAARFFKWILGDKRDSVVRSLKVHFLYPHHLAELGEEMKVWAFFRPINQERVMVFISMYIKSSGIQRMFHRPFKALFSPLILRRIQVQDAWAGVQEQIAWRLYPTEARCETNPISVAVERLLLKKWNEGKPAQLGPQLTSSRRAT